MRLAALILCAVLSYACGRPDTGTAELPPPVITDPGETDIWVAELLDSGRRLRLGTPYNATDRPGYDNQPRFLDDGNGFLYTAIDGGIADVWRHDLQRVRNVRITDTEESEYSPTPLPDGSGFAAVRVELDGRQRLWQFDMDGGAAQRVFDGIEPVGYHAWVDMDTVGMFVLGQPPVFVVATPGGGEAREWLRSIGRSLHAIPGRGAFSVLHKASEDRWVIVSVDPSDGAITELATALRPAEDYAWTPDGQLLMARGSRVFIHRAGEGAEWSELADFADHGIGQITRIAVSPRGDRVAFVVQR